MCVLLVLLDNFDTLFCKQEEGEYFSFNSVLDLPCCVRRIHIRIIRLQNCDPFFATEK